jgi:transposase
MNNSKKKIKANVDWQKLDVMHPNAAGIDVGGSEHFVAIPPERDSHPVRSFGCFTAELYRLADWLKEQGIDTVVMQSTGSFWVPLYEILAQRGFEVFLVNAHHTKNLPGRKSDVQECQWLLKLHTFGLLNNSFQPSDEIRVLRTLWRHAGLVAEAGSCMQRIQKGLTEMNVQLCNVISDLSGATGLAILDAILSGERDAWKLAALAHPGVKAKPAEIAASLQGNWRNELLFVIEQQLELYRFHQRKIGQCDRKLQPHVRTLESKVDLKAQPLGPRRKGKKAQGNAPKFDLRQELYRTTGVDWTKVDGIDVMVPQTVIAETGVDMQAWPTEGHFASWLGVCPINDISGGKVLRRGTRRVLNRATVAFRQAASTLLRSQSYLGAQYRRLRTSIAFQ